MRFSLAVVLAAVGLTEAHIGASRLLARAIPVNKDGSPRQVTRGLADQITANSIVKFDSCLSMKVKSSDLQDENLYSYVAGGKVVAATNYVTFNVGSAEDAFYGSESNLYMVTLAQWLQSIFQQNQNTKEQYCEACVASYDYCFPAVEEVVEEEAAQEVAQEEPAQEEAAQEEVAQEEPQEEAVQEEAAQEEVQAEGDEGAARKLTEYYTESEWQVPINCTTCESLGCFNADAAAEVVYCDQAAFDPSVSCVFKDEDLANFMMQAACAQSGEVEYLNNIATNIMYGYMCNEQQTGIEMAMFLDQNCMMYDKSRSFVKSMNQTYQYAALHQMASKVQALHTSEIKCMLMQYAAMAAEGQVIENQNNQAQINNICANILTNALDIETCGGAAVEAIEEASEEYIEAEQDDFTLSFYKYDVEEDDNLATVCLKLNMDNGKFGEYHVYEGNSAYGGGGTVFDYSKGNANSGLSPGGIAGIIVAILVVIVAGAMIGMSYAQKKADSKKVPLVFNQVEGAEAT